MPNMPRRALTAALVGLLVLLIAHWFDAGVLADAQRRAGYSYDVGPLVDLTGVAHIVTAAGVLAIALAAWRSKSLAVGVGYAAVGGFLVSLPALFWAFAVSVNGAPTVAPQPIASTLTSWYLTVAAGVTGAVFIVAAAMFLSGLAVVGSVFRAGRRGVTAAPTAEGAAPEPA